MNSPYIDIHTHSETKERDVVKIYSYLLESGKPPPDLPFSAGVHPWHAKDTNFSILDAFPRSNPNLVAVGEIGLDYAVKNLDKDRQAEWFRKQLQLAQEINLPVVIHCVKAYDDVLYEVKKNKVKAAVIHSFTGSPELARQMIDNGFHLSFGVNSLRSHKTTEALKNIPADKIFLETDDSGADIKQIYRQVAEVLGTGDDELRKTVYDNYKRIFG